MTDPETLYTAIRDEVKRVFVGNDDVIEGLVVALLTRGHVLLEGVPGVAKTTLANSFARATGLDYGRIQMTPDLLPPDITGTYVYHEHSGEFELQRGPIFHNVVLADEINRTTPKTQSALLEAMQERQVTLRNEMLELPDPFMLIATQNPVEMVGVYELPEAQRDRFQMKLSVDVPDTDGNRELLDRFDHDPNLGPQQVRQVVTPEEILDAQQQLSDVHASDAVKEYIRRLTDATRASPNIEHGASPRAMLTLLNASKGRAMVRGRDYVTPDDVKETARRVFVHRLVLSNDADFGGRSTEDVLEQLLEEIEPPDHATAADGSGHSGDDFSAESDSPS